METLHDIETILQNSKRPLTLNRISALLPRKVMHRTLRAAIEHYKRLGFVTEGSKGILWTLCVKPDFFRTVETWEAR